MAVTDAITQAITDSMADAGLNESADADTGVDDTGGQEEATADATEAATAEGDDDAGDSTPDPAVEAEGETKVEPTAEEKAASDRAAELAELGLTPPKPGQKENRIPQPRVVKMIEKAQEKVKTALTAQITEKDAKIHQLQGVADTHQNLNALADADPVRFVEALAVANPKVWKPILARLSGAPVAASESKAAATEFKPGSPMPEPNVKLADGSLTYDQKGLVALMAWGRDEATAAATEKVTKQFEDRFGPIEEDRKQAAWRAEAAPRIAAQIAEARKEWGQAFEEDYQKAERGEKSEILTYINEMKAKGTPVSLEKACQVVLLPKLRVDRTKMRAELIAELNKRPAAVTPARTQVKEASGPRTIEQAIKDSMTAAGL